MRISGHERNAEASPLQQRTSLSLNCLVPSTACSSPSFLDALSNISASKDLKGEEGEEEGIGDEDI